MNEWVDVRGPSVEVAVTAALQELGLDSADAAEVEVLQEPTRGFLGMGGQDAVVRVRRKPASSGGSSRSRSRRGSRGGSSSGGGSHSSSKSPSGSQRSSAAPSSNRGGSSGPSSGRQPKQPSAPKGRTPRKEQSSRSGGTVTKRDDDDRQDIPPAEQAEAITSFLTGLLEAFGLEGEVTTTVDDDVIQVDVVGEQTEALVGQKGVILQSVLELCRTIVQRRTMSGARIRLDIAGYTERRREALRIYTRRLTEKIVAEGGEVMLEPMNSADRKVVHDTVAEIDGVRSFSEGEEPHRSVVIARDGGGD
jgi:spoIIIJ-associated protein